MRDKAPNPEWVLMYRKGLSRGQIADVVGAPSGTVGYHLGVARAQHPGLQAEHEAAAPAKTTTVTPQGLESMKKLITMLRETGRYPSRNAIEKSERTLAAWLQRRRVEARNGRLAPAFRDGLAEVPDWEGTPRKVADDAKWEDNLGALVAYRAAGLDWPRHKPPASSEEHGLGIWLHAQRYKLHRGQLDAAKVNALDSATPGWRTGRRRGRKPVT